MCFGYSLFRRFVNPKIKKGTLVRTFVALFRRLVIPKVRLSEKTRVRFPIRLVYSKIKYGSLFGRFANPKIK